MENELMQLYEKAKEELASYPAAQQVIMIRTSQDHVYTFPIDSIGEDGKIAESLWQSGDTVIRHLICMWDDGSVDVPSFQIRQQLLDLNPENAKALLLLQGENGLLAKQLQALMPG